MTDLSREEIKQQLQQMDPYEFEKLVAELWELQGYETTVRQESGDRGIDVEATKDTPFEQKILIQVKRYADGNKVGSEEVRNYATLYQQVPNIDSVVIITTGDFTSEAERLASDLNVKLVDGDDTSKLAADNLSESEINKYTNIGTQYKDIDNNTVRIGDSVEIVSGVYKTHSGVVEGITDRSAVTVKITDVTVSIPVTVEFEDIRLISTD